jgi:outer membrane protein TolC
MEEQFSIKWFAAFLVCLFGISGFALCQDTLDLSQAITMGLENNYDIKISNRLLDITSNNNSIGNAGFLPEVDLSGQRRFTNENTSQTFANGQEQIRDGAKSNSTNAGAVINWTIFDGVGMFHRKSRLDVLEKQGSALNESVVQSIIAEIGKEFYTVALEQLREQLLKENILLSEVRINIARNKYEFGKASKMEYLQAQVDLNRDKSNLMIQQERLAASKTALNELLARDVTLDFYVKFDPELNRSLQFDELRESLLVNNPELSAGRNQIDASILEKKEIASERIPQLDVSAGYNFIKSESEAGFSLQRRSSGFNYGIGASWNIFDGLNLNRRIQNAEIAFENSQLDYEARKLNLERALYSTFITYQNNIRLHELEQENRTVARENNEIATERYRIGNTSPLELREAQINLLEANIRLLNAAYAIKTAEIDLLLLAGLITQ